MPENEQRTPPGNWTPEGCRRFYEKHGKSAAAMVDILETIPGIADPYAFAASVKDFCEQDTGWRPGRTPVNPSAENAPVVKNPKKWRKKDMKLAAEIFEDFMGREPEKVSIARLEIGTALVKLARVHSVTYIAEKGDPPGPESKYQHDFEGDIWLYWDLNNNCFIIWGDGLAVTEAGIDG